VEGNMNMANVSKEWIPSAVIVEGNKVRDMEEVRKNAAQVQNVRIKEGLSYSEAVKKVGKTLDSGKNGKGIPQQKMEKDQEETKENFGIKNDVAFVAFS